MAEENDTTHENSDCSVEVSPSEVDAGADMTLKGKVSCSPAGDLRGTPLLIMDQYGVLVERIDLTEFDGETNETREFVVRAPAKPGAYTWLAVCPAHAMVGMSLDERSAPFSFTVKPHTTRVVVWGAPSAIECGEKFSINLGVKCSAECKPDGWMVEVLDQDRTQQATATLGDEPWPDTAALYHTEVNLNAPDIVGLYSWEATASMNDLDIPHTESTARFGVRVVPTPEWLLTIVAIDMEKQTPVKGAKVVVHPYTAVTDDRGVAEVRIPEGKYRLFVSGKNYFPFRSDGEVKTNVTIRAELALDLELSDADVWS